MRLLLHLVRGAPPLAVAECDWIVYLERPGSAGPRSLAEGRGGDILERPGSAGPRSLAEGRGGDTTDRMELADHGEPRPFPAGPIDHDQLVELIFTADLVVTW